MTKGKHYLVDTIPLDRRVKMLIVKRKHNVHNT